MWYHLTGFTGLSREVASLGRYGYLGVEAFFVVSGFVIPLAMHRRGYRLRDAGRFVGRRIARLDPPYLVTAALAMLVGRLAGGAEYVAPSAAQIAAHLGYATAVLGFEWLSPVFWTLGIEFQFYLVMAVAFGVVAHERDALALPALAAAALAPLVVASDDLLPHWAGLFVMGTVAFRARALGTPVLAASAVGAVAFVATGLADTKGAAPNGLPEALVGAVAAVWLLRGRLPNLSGRVGSAAVRAVFWLGTVSYSLYLAHWVFGRGAVTVARIVPVIGEAVWFRLAAGICASLVSAWAMHGIVERPAIAWSSRLFGPPPEGPAGCGAGEAGAGLVTALFSASDR